MFKKDLSVFSDFVTFKGAVGYPPMPHPHRIAHLSSLRHLEFPKLMDFQNSIHGPAVLVAVNCQRGQACSCACGDDLITFTEVGRPTHYGWHHSLSKEFWVVLDTACWLITIIPVFICHLVLTAQPCDQLPPDPLALTCPDFEINPFFL